MKVILLDNKRRGTFPALFTPGEAFEVVHARRNEVLFRRLEPVKADSEDEAGALDSSAEVAGEERAVGE